MDVDEILYGLTDLTGYPVEEGKYLGNERKYIVYVYEDERPSDYGDDTAIADILYIQLSLFAPKSYQYKCDKKKIRNYLESHGFQVTSIQSWIDQEAITGTEDIRRITYTINYTLPREKEEE